MLIPAKREKLFEQLLISLSLANLCFFGMWIQLLALASPAFSYHRPIAPDWHLIGALVLDILALALILSLAFWLQTSIQHWLRLIGKLLFAAISLFAVAEIAQLIWTEVSKRTASAGLSFLQAALILALAVLVFLLPQRSVRVWRRVLLIASPLFFILAVNALWLYRAPVLHKLGRGHAAGMLQHPRKTNIRVVWIIFDEMDQRLAFDARPKRIHLPHLDRFLAASLHASKARPPAGETLYSLPSLICGRKVQDARLSPADLYIQFYGTNRFVPWSEQPNLFSRARAEGFNTGLSGWYHSYCRVIGRDLSACYWDGSGGSTGYPAEDFLRKRSMLDKASYLANWQSRSIPFLSVLGAVSPQPRAMRLEKAKQASEYRAITGNALQMLRKQDISLVMIHLPVPHPPGIWNAQTHSFTTDLQPDYFDNLELADKAFGLFRKTLEEEGDWDRSAVLVSSDHMFRVCWRQWKVWDDELERETRNQDLRYIPFLLKLPGQKQGSVYPKQFDTVVSQALLWEILNGRIETPPAAAAWLDNHSS